MPSPACRPAPFFPILAHRYPRAAEQRKITISTQRGAIRLEEQVRVETLVSISKISRHHPSRYPFMAFLESGMVRDRLGLVERMSMVELGEMPRVEERISRVELGEMERVVERVSRVELGKMARVSIEGVVEVTTSLRFFVVGAGHTSSSRTPESSG